MGNTPNTVAEADAKFAHDALEKTRHSDSVVPRRANGAQIPHLPAVVWLMLVRVLIFAIPVAISVLSIIYSVMSGAADNRPSFIDELRAGRVTPADVTSVSILKFDPGAGWPSKEAHYARKARVAIPGDARSALAKLLRESTTDGHPSRNHPASFYQSILRIDVGAKGHYYVFCEPFLYEGKNYVVVETGALNNTNPNGVKKYENIPLAGFLKKYDPWYRDANSPPIKTRPSYPDDKP